jgi:hypothetical protein
LRYPISVVVQGIVSLVEGGRGGRGGKNGRGGKGGNKKMSSKEDLDADLDNYMNRDPETAAANLDADLDAYMAQRSS